MRNRQHGEDRDEAGRWTSIVSFTHGVKPTTASRTCTITSSSAPSPRARARCSTVVGCSRTCALPMRSIARRCDNELAEQTPWSAWRSFQGIEHVAGLDEGYRSCGEDTIKNAARSCSGTATRPCRRGARIANDSCPRASSRHRAERRTLDEHRFAGALEGRPDVARRHVVEAWSNAARFGQNAAALSHSIDALYPELRGSRGVREPVISVREARMTSLVRERGERPLQELALDQCRQRSRDRSIERSDRPGSHENGGARTRASAPPHSSACWRRDPLRSRAAAREFAHRRSIAFHPAGGATGALAARVRTGGLAWEPACGRRGGATSRVLGGPRCPVTRRLSERGRGNPPPTSPSGCGLDSGPGGRRSVKTPWPPPLGHDARQTRQWGHVGQFVQARSSGALFVAVVGGVDDLFDEPHDERGRHGLEAAGRHDVQLVRPSEKASRSSGASREEARAASVRTPA